MGWCFQRLDLNEVFIHVFALAGTFLGPILKGNYPVDGHHPEFLNDDALHALLHAFIIFTTH